MVLKLTCEICKTPFENKTVRRTCGKECKRQLQRLITQAQFSNAGARHLHQEATRQGMKNVDLKTLIQTNRRSYKGKNHPSYGVERSPEWRENISKGNTGKLKGKTWDDILGPELATIRRTQNSDAMIATNVRLLNNRFSVLEKKIANYLPEFKRNKHIGNWIVDLFDPNTNTVIEVNGDYWHGNPKVYSTDDFISQLNMTVGEKNVADDYRNDQLRQMGYNVIVLWESDVKDKTREEIRTLVETAKTQVVR